MADTISIKMVAPYVPKGVTVNASVDRYDLYEFLEQLPELVKGFHKMTRLERLLRTVFNRPVHT